jgi:hypothetical protein
VQPLPELRAKVIGHLQAWPRAGVAVAPDVRSLQLELEGRTFVVIYRRVGNRLGLMHVIQLPQGRALLEERVKMIRELYGKGGAK